MKAGWIPKYFSSLAVEKNLNLYKGNGQEPYIQGCISKGNFELMISLIVLIWFWRVQKSILIQAIKDVFLKKTKNKKKNLPFVPTINFLLNLKVVLVLLNGQCF